MRGLRTDHRSPLQRAAQSAFTLVEVIVVVLILGILGGVAAPKLMGAKQDANVKAFVAQLMAYADAFDLYKAANGFYPVNANTGVLPTGMDQYISPTEFAKATPIGGRWDYAAVGQGSNAGVGVEYLNGIGYPGNDVCLEVDRLLDDGNLATGNMMLVNASTKWLYWRYGN